MAQAIFARGENAYFLCILQVYRFSAIELWRSLCNKHVQWGCWWELKKRRRLGLLLMVCWERNLCICFPLLFIGEKYLTESKDSSLSRLLFLVASLMDQLSSPGGPSLSSSFFSSEDPCLLSSSLFTCHSLSWGIKSRSWGHASPFFEQPLSISLTGWKIYPTNPKRSPFFYNFEDQELATNWKSKSVAGLEA